MAEGLEIRVSVRALVEESLRGGDLLPGGGIRRMLEGAQGHRALQAQGGAQNEVSVSGAVEEGGARLLVQGRIDRLLETEPPCVEEIKTILSPPEELTEGQPVHWAQALVYACLYMRVAQLPEMDVALCYYHLPTGRTKRFCQRVGSEQAEGFFLSLALPYLRARVSEAGRMEELSQALKALPFPFTEFRPGQRQLAAQVYLALRDGRRLLIQAPTGTGKTMAVLFPALKALGEGKCEKLFYLSARGTGKLAALDAARRLAVPGLRCLELAARSRLCPRGEEGCAFPCKLAEGYYDRLDEALRELFSGEGPYTAETIRRTALEHSLCPHEFALDASLSCELVIGDYNYLFDPRVRLQRFFGTGKNRYALLVDEAHNLPARGREMYSASLEAKPLQALRRAVPRGSARRERPYLALKALCDRLEEECAEEETPFAREGPPGEELCALVEEVLGYLERDAYPPAPGSDELLGMLSSFLYAASRWEDSMLRLCEGGKTTHRLRLFCRDASAFLARDIGRFQGAVLFSATLSPGGFYRALCGLSPEDAFLSLPSPFPPENLCCLQLSIDTRFRRREETLPLAARAVAALVQSREKGSFLAFCPSYAYLRMLERPLRELLPEGVTLLVQEREMDETARERFLSGFPERPQGRTLGLAVLGGVFAEGVDLPGERLCGAAVIGVGLPQVGPETELLRACFEERYGDGFACAYLYPGLCRVLQAAGRIIRSETDRGALLLLDDRYLRPPYPELLPPHWQVRRMRDVNEMQAALTAFWNEEQTP